MILNTFPINSLQEMPQFVVNFYADVMEFLKNYQDKQVDVNEAVCELLLERKLHASIGLHTVAVDSWSRNNIGRYIILCWEDEHDLAEFIDFYCNEVKLAPPPFASYHH
jgi:hypothetical protein